MAQELPPGFTAPVCHALTTVHKIGGVPRNVFYLNVTVTLAAVVGFSWYWYLLLSIPLHYLVKIATKYDEHWLSTLFRSLCDAEYYDA